MKRKKRKYTLGRRAESQSETRQRIVEAAVDLHSTVGPARTTVSMLAERAGVQRHTVYAHFPDERSLFLACSGLFYERDPLPDPEPWRSVGDRQGRLRAGLGALYGWYARNASMMACVQRDAEYHALVREMGELRFKPFMKAYGEVLGQSLDEKQRALLKLALGFSTWRALVPESGLTEDAAAEVMAQAIAGKSEAG